MPRTIACGGRESTFDSFRTALETAQEGDFPIMLVDSEQPVFDAPWEHLRLRDGWVTPSRATDEHAQLVVVCMETWITADRATLRRVFGKALRETALPTMADLESRSKKDVQQGLEDATKGCERHRRYSKGRRSFQVLGELDAALLEREAPHFKRLIETLRARV